METETRVNSKIMVFVDLPFHSKNSHRCCTQREKSSVGAAGRVSPNWSQEKMTCHSCFSIVWGQGKAPVVTSLPSSCNIPSHAKSELMLCSHYTGQEYRIPFAPPRKSCRIHTAFAHTQERLWRYDLRNGAKLRRADL